MKSVLLRTLALALCLTLPSQVQAAKPRTGKARPAAGQAAAKADPPLLPLAEAARPPDDDLASRLLAAMTLEEKAGQIIMSYPPIDPEAPVIAGSVIFVGSLLRSADGVKKRIEGLQKRSRIPLLVSADMEGGKLNRLRFVKSLRNVPSNQELGKGDEANARAWGRTVGKGMKGLGFNCNLGPVLDLADSGLMFETGRSMGGDAAKVARLGRAYAEGIWSEGVIPVGKHFPGYGDLEKNSDHFLLVSDRPLETIQQHAAAFTQVGDWMPSVMLTNVGFTAYGSVPAIFSPEIVALAHQGHWLTMTDDLSVKTLSEATAGDQDEVVRKAFLAGNDILLTTAPFDWDKGMNAHKVVVDLVKSKPELLSRLEESALRVLRLKQKMGLLAQVKAPPAVAPQPAPAAQESAAAPVRDTGTKPE